ncbi:acyl carrier protein [Nocardioides sp. MAH-18]|uniref:Acyl carrier protein n=1 Tax=Nocardioides agri TaxID=2682843 RepID=A0A6L6XP44_9ACTN|nr:MULTISPECIES: phosphopantetheine-binding protein [unclassified Nocardioides]MBA2954230.1 acyl carrier protein [Nocardioides sp. CGMCC 1.13656]MVQ49091.1 acyl carrier protein [Nocardioides sp. MAH-18]
MPRPNTEESKNVDASTEAPVSDVVDVLVHVLGIEDRRETIDAGTALLGELPELDSLAVVELAVALEERFDIVIDDDDFTGDVFETVGTLAAFIHEKSRNA